MSCTLEVTADINTGRLTYTCTFYVANTRKIVVFS